MSPLRNRTAAVALALAATTASLPVLAAAADAVRVRVAGFKQLGKDFKAVNDGLRVSDLAKVRAGAAGVINASRAQYRWFPAGSGPQAGVQTHARPAVWARAGEFRKAQDAFAREAAAFQRVAAGSDIAVIRAQSRKLGASCKGCHDVFREEDD